MTDRALAEVLCHQTPLTLPPEATVAEASRAMHERRVGCVLVVDAEQRLLGVFTGRDSVRLLAGPGPDPRGRPLSEVMTRDPATLPAGARAIEALRLMNDGGFRHVPILEGDRLVGVVSRYDFRAKEYGRLDTETGLWERI